MSSIAGNAMALKYAGPFVFVSTEPPPNTPSVGRSGRSVSPSSPRADRVTAYDSIFGVVFIIAQYRPPHRGFSTRIVEKTLAKIAFRYRCTAGPDSFSRTACFSSPTRMFSRGQASKYTLVFNGLSEFR